MFLVLSYALPAIGGLALAALLARWVVRAITRTDGASEADPLLASYDLHRQARETGDATTQSAAQAAEALAAAAKLLPLPGIAGTVRTWLANPELDIPRQLLTHHGTDTAYQHAQVLADLAEHPQRQEFTRLVQDALDRAEAPKRAQR
mgnify:CR=1 FL=1